MTMATIADFLQLLPSAGGAAEMPCPHGGGRRTFPNVRWNMPGAVRFLIKMGQGRSEIGFPFRLPLASLVPSWDMRDI